MPCILCRVKGWYFEGWGGSKMVSCASRLPQLAVLFCFASNCSEISTSGLPPLSIWLLAAIHVEEDLHIVLSNVQLLSFWQLGIASCLQNFKLRSFFAHFLWLWLKRVIHNFDKMLQQGDLFALLLNFLRVNSLGLRGGIKKWYFVTFRPKGGGGLGQSKKSFSENTQTFFLTKGRGGLTQSNKRDFLA